MPASKSRAKPSKSAPKAAKRSSPKPKPKPKPKSKSKSTATKVVSLAKPEGRRPFPFPFFGQGDAGYYEWFEMWIWFREPVPASRRSALLSDAPAPCARDAQWPHAALLWASTGDQWIHQHLIEAYGTKERIVGMRAEHERQESGDELDFEDDEDEERLVATLATVEVPKFNAHIEQWLRSMHAKVPIAFAVRRQDSEAGGTRLGPWHRDSVSRFAADVLPAFEALSRKPPKMNDMRREAIGLVLDYVGEKTVSPAVRKLGILKD